MKVVIPLIFTYDAADWADEYGIPEAQAPTDFTAMITRAVDDGGIADVLGAQWPAMRGHISTEPLVSVDESKRRWHEHELALIAVGQCPHQTGYGLPHTEYCRAEVPRNGSLFCGEHR